MPRQLNSFAPLPREHGAWGLLLQSFLAGALLGGRWTWLLIPACLLALLGFLLKEPLITVARQRFVWRQPMPETRAAIPWLAGEVLLVLACLVTLARSVPLPELGGLAAAGLVLTIVAVWLTVKNRQRSMVLQIVSAAGLVLTIVAVWLTVKNRQRSMVLQIVSAAGLCSSALLAALAATSGIPAWAWSLWAILTAHATTSIPVVHIRLQRKIAVRTKSAPDGAAVGAWIWGLPLLALPAVVWRPALAIPLAFSLAASMAERRRVATEDGLQEPLRRVGFRLLAVSIAHTLLTIALLW